MVDLFIPEGAFLASEEAVLTTWYYASGAHVPEGAALCDVMVAKAQIEIPAPCAGVLTIRVAEGSNVFPGQLIGALTPE